MEKILDYNPLTGVTEIFHHDPHTDTSVIEMTQDVTASLELAKAMRNDESYSKDGIKRDWWHVGHIPDMIILKMRFEDGVDIYNRDHWAKVGQLLNDKYSYFKTTDGTHKFKG